jgi:two-component system, OmpR family, osmolarity sensor histidine kinase EnvZ
VLRSFSTKIGTHIGAKFGAKLGARWPRGSPRPWSLVRRLTGGVALIALLSFAAQAVVLWLWLRPVADDLAGIAAEQALMAQAALQAVAASDRAALAEKMSSGGVLVTAERPPPGQAITELPPPPREAEAGGVPGPRNIFIQFQGRPGEEFAATFRLPVDGEDWWLTREYRATRGAVSGTLVVWLVMLAVATVGALLVSVQLIARPFGRLAEQISHQQSAVGPGSLTQGLLQPLPESRDGSAELQALVRAFNTLAYQVSGAAQTRQQLLAGVSHDLRTPLARLRLRAETQCEPELAEALTADLRALERIVDQFLAYVQGDGVAALGNREPVQQVVRDVVGLYADGPQAVSLELSPAGAVIDTPVPDLALQRLLANLIDNAFAYGRAPVQVQLHQAAGKEGRQGFELRVMDHGAGMSQTEFARAQQPFVRLTGARSELGHCGLGLAIVAQMARQMGGRLHTVHEAPGTGPDQALPRFGIVFSMPV